MQERDPLSWLHLAGARLAPLHDQQAVLDEICTLLRHGLGADRLSMVLVEADPCGQPIAREVRAPGDDGTPAEAAGGTTVDRTNHPRVQIPPSLDAVLRSGDAII